MIRDLGAQMQGILLLFDLFPCRCFPRYVFGSLPVCLY